MTFASILGYSSSYGKNAVPTLGKNDVHIRPKCTENLKQCHALNYHNLVLDW